MRTIIVEIRFSYFIVLLYCVSPEQRDSWGGTIEGSPSYFLSNMDKTIYRTEPHEWDDEMRLMLAQTIGKSCEMNGNVVETKKRPSDTEEEEDTPSKKRRIEQLSTINID